MALMVKSSRARTLGSACCIGSSSVRTEVIASQRQVRDRLRRREAMFFEGPVKALIAEVLFTVVMGCPK